jgi:Tfp pilus assembly protein PilN
MRPVNLIPPEERPGGRKPLRSGPLAYIVVGAFALALIAITALIVTNSKISDRKSEVTQLESRQTTLEAKATALAPYNQFTSVREQRQATITSLAQSRFDWERVLTELSLVIPPDVQLSSLDGSAAAGVATSGAGGAMRMSIPGPAFEIVGCAPSQAAVAEFIEALKEIDGVTRVGMSSSTGGESESGGAASASTCEAGGQNFQFAMVAGFDAAPVPQVEGSEEEVAPEAAPEGESTSSESTESTSSEAPPAASGGETEGTAD